MRKDDIGVLVHDLYRIGGVAKRLDASHACKVEEDRRDAENVLHVATHILKDDSAKRGVQRNMKASTTFIYNYRYI